MRRGNGLPILLIGFVFTAIAIFGLSVFFFQSRDESAVTVGGELLGLGKTRNGVDPTKLLPGQSAFINVSIVSTEGTWELYEFLCKSRTECVGDAFSGKKNQVLGGGATQLHEVSIALADDWQDYTYLKLFVKSGWGGKARNFDSEISGARAGQLEDIVFAENSGDYNVVLVPLQNIAGGYEVRFTD